VPSNSEEFCPITSPFFFNDQGIVMMDSHEKADSAPNLPEIPDEVSSGPTLDEERIEKSLIRKIDIHILPFVVLLYLFSFLDRGTCILGWGDV
jgi:hypothetical protein